MQWNRAENPSHRMSSDLVVGRRRWQIFAHRNIPPWLRTVQHDEVWPHTVLRRKMRATRRRGKSARSGRRLKTRQRWGRQVKKHTTFFCFLLLCVIKNAKLHHPPLTTHSKLFFSPMTENVANNVDITNKGGLIVWVQKNSQQNRNKMRSSAKKGKNYNSN